MSQLCAGCESRKETAAMLEEGFTPCMACALEEAGERLEGLRTENKRVTRERDTLSFANNALAAQLDRLQVALSRAIGACVDAGGIAVPDKPEQLEAAIAELARQRDEAREALDEWQTKYQHLAEVRQRGCDCNDEEACRFVRERDEWRRLHSLVLDAQALAMQQRDEARAKLHSLHWDLERANAKCADLQAAKTDAGQVWEHTYRAEAMNEQFKRKGLQARLDAVTKERDEARAQLEGMEGAHKAMCATVTPLSVKLDAVRKYCKAKLAYADTPLREQAVCVEVLHFLDGEKAGKG